MDCCLGLQDEMAALGFDDSKALTDEIRVELLAKILEHSDMMAWMVHVLSPNTISTSMLRRFKYNLNALSHDTAIGECRYASRLFLSKQQQVSNNAASTHSL